jgi:hypothetical protein
MIEKLRIKTICTFALGLFITCGFGVYSSQASEKHKKEHDHEKRQLESHEHGVSTLKIALEGQSLEMQLESPANDIVGFEHAPENKIQKTAVARALTLLKSKSGIFKTPSAANCRIDNVSGDFEVEKDHAGFHIIWKIICLSPKQLNNLETTFFQKFPKAKEIEVEVISASGQKAIEWENDVKMIKLPALSK